jgi:hypothetical protein
MVAMETPGPDDLADDDAVIAHRARAKAELGQIARQAKQALADAGIDTFGTITDPPDDEWEQVGEIVSAIVGQTVGGSHSMPSGGMCSYRRS